MTSLPVQRALDSRASQEMFGSVPVSQYTIVTGVVEVLGSGSLSHHLRFPAQFVSVYGFPPMLSAIGVAGESDKDLDDGVLDLPSWDISVADWVLEERDYLGSPLYVGAVLFISKFGTRPGSVFWRCEGPALTFGGV